MQTAGEQIASQPAMLKALLTAAFMAVLVCGSLGQGVAAERVALLIGNSKYVKGRPLRNPLNDVNMLGEALKRAGFESVTISEDKTRAGMLLDLERFSYVANHADIAVVYFSGHGTETAGKNYLLPTDYSGASVSSISDAAISLDQVLRSLDGARALKLVLLDACRADTSITFATSNKDEITHAGLTEIEPREPNTLIAFAAKAGAFALDGDTRDSPFAVALARRLLEPGLDVQLALRKVRDDVLTYTGGFQEPIAFGTLSGRVVPLSKELPEFTSNLSAPLTSTKISDDDAMREVRSVFDNNPNCQYHRYSDLSVIGKSVSGEVASALVKIRISNTGQAMTTPDENRGCGHGKFTLWPQQGAYLVIRATLRHYDTGWRLEDWEPGWLAADNSWHSAH